MEDLGQTTVDAPEFAVWWPPKREQSLAYRCFLVVQRVRGATNSVHTLHFYLDSFGEALEVANAQTSGWKHESIFLIAGRNASNAVSVAVKAALFLPPYSYLCTLMDGEEVLISGGANFRVEGNTHRPVWVYGVEPSEFE